MEILVKSADDAALRRLLEAHPNVRLQGVCVDHTLEILQGDRHRSIDVGMSDIEPSGLVELVDNNPLVCADAVGIPDAAATLALIALQPLIRAGLLQESPTLMFSFEPNSAVVEAFLNNAGWRSGTSIFFEDQNLGSVLACTCMALIETPAKLEEIDELYDEAFGRSFFVRRDEESEWFPDLVSEKPWAAYRLRITPDEPSSLLTIQVLADKNGKCGAAQIVHAMNVMTGFEESLGIL